MVEAHTLLILGQGFTMEKDRACPLALPCFSVPVTWSTTLVSRHLKTRRGRGPYLPIYIAFCYRLGACRSLHLISPCDLVPFKMYVHISVAL
jgi:hypothetical protein